MEYEKINKNHCINSRQFNLDQLYQLCKLADKLRELNKLKEGTEFISSLLNDKRAILYFNQPSTRTFLSFQNACYILGIKCSEIRDINTSSFAKGESELDAVKTFSRYVNLIIMRHTDSDFVNLIANNLNDNMCIINAGSGTDQHPTQALLDFYTIYKFGFDNKKVGFVGDLKRGRTVRSLALVLSKIVGLKLYFIAPKEFQIKEDILNQLTIEYEVIEDFDSVISELDVIYMTRLQKEYGGIDIELDRSKYCLNKDNLIKLKKDAIIMHPLPRVDEIAVEIDNDSRAKYWDQVENGMWIRAALIATMFNIDKKILNYYKMKKIKLYYKNNKIIIKKFLIKKQSNFVLIKDNLIL